MSGALYTRDILRLAVSIPHLGVLEEPDGEADLRSPTCGSRVRVMVRLDREQRIARVAQEVEACAFGQASAALMGAHAVGRSRQDVADAIDDLQQWLSGASDEPSSWPDLSVLAPARERSGRHGAILLPFRALLAALDASAKGAPPAR